MDKKRKKRRRRKNPIHFLLIAIVLYISWTFISQQMRLNELAREEEELKKQYEELYQEEQKLLEEKDMIDDPEYIEKVARERLKMVKPNEIIYIDKERAKYLD